MSDSKIDTNIWTVIDSYFKNVDNYLSKNQLDSYNAFIDINIPKTIRQFNPISFLKAPIPGTDKNRIEIDIIIGGSLGENNEIINDGKGIYIGKPCIREINKTEGTENKKILFPNEARLKNLTYVTEILVDVLIKYTINDDSIPSDKRVKVKVFEKVPLGELPVMLQSKICSLHESKKSTLRMLGECEYDQGGYFIITGKEKVLISQERQFENKIYVNYNDDAEKHKYKYESEIRSAPENKFQPAYITKIVCLYEKGPSIGQSFGVEENTFRVIVPKLDSGDKNKPFEIPLFVMFRALGIISDKDIINLIVNDIDSKIGKQMLDILRPSIVEGHQINNQIDALDFLQNRISSSFMDLSISYERKRRFLTDLLRNKFLPHVGTNLLNKAHFLGYMVNQVLLTHLQIKSKTDRDSYMYKRIDQSGFLISAIFRDLYFRIIKDTNETINKTYSKKDEADNGTHWLNQIGNPEDYTYNIHNLVGNFGDNSNIGELVTNVIKDSIMSEGWIYAFKNCWGLKNATGCKEGVVQDLARLTFIGFMSHLRRINTPLSDSAKVREPHQLHPTTWGIMCPPETPDGKEIGLRKHLAIMAIISSGTNSNALLRALYNCSLESITQVDFEKNNLCRVFLNERLVGYTRNPKFMHRKLKLLKRNALINIYTSITWIIDEMVIKISTDSGRALRPLFILGENNTHLLTDEIISKLKDNDNPFNWKHLVGGTRFENKKNPYEDTDPNYYYIKELEDDLDKLEKTAGIIEYTDKEEENTLLIAMNPSDLLNSSSVYSHIEIHPGLIYGVPCLTTPSMEMNQAPRNQFSAGQGKQALGVYASNFRNRMDNKGQILHYPQRSIVKNKLEKYTFVDDLPFGMNAIVALGCYSGYNQDDSIIINKSSVERGLFHTTKFRTYDERDEVENGKILKKIMLPKEINVKKFKNGNRSKLDENGIIKEQIKVTDNDVIIGKCEMTGDKDANGNEIYNDVSVLIKLNEDGIVDKVYSNKGNDDQNYVKVRIRKHKIPELGDKFCARHGQKGTIGMLIKQLDLPVSKFGITPDMIINPQAFPSRMTNGQFLELLLGKASINYGYLNEIAPFSTVEFEKVGDMLEKVGFERYGNEVMYSGINGEQMHMSYYIGPTFYERLTHQVSDKYQSREDGMRDALTREPVGGRSQGGGGRVGEMERDALLSHGVSSFLKESFMERSNKYQFYLSNKSGLIAPVNKSKNIARDLTFDESLQYVTDDKQVEKRQIDSTNSKFSCIETPYALKLFLQELETMGIAPRIITENNKEEWKPISSVPKKILEASPITDDLNVDDVTVKSPLFPYYKLINRIREILISSTLNNGSLLDFSYDNGKDIFKWKNAGFKYIASFVHDKTSDYVDIDTFITNLNKNIMDSNISLDLKAWTNSSKLLNFNFTTNSFDKLQSTDPILKIFDENGFNSFDTITFFSNFESLFTSKKHIENFFNNAKMSLSSSGYLLINALDGEKIFNLLKKLKGTPIEGKFFDSTSNKHINLWSIKPSTGLDLAADYLNSDFDNFTNQNISILYPGMNQEVNIPLIHPTTILTFAKKFGFDLVPSSTVKMLFPSFNKSWGSFKESLNTLLNINFDSELDKLKHESFRDVLKFIELNNFYILKVSNENIVPNHVYNNNEVSKCSTDKLTVFEPKYSEFKLPIHVSFDATMLNHRITQMRSLYGNVNNKKQINMDFASGNYNKYDISVFVKDINNKLESDTFKNMGYDNFKNSITYLFEHIKLGIYVRFINSTMVVFAPMFNVDYDINNSLKPDIDNIDINNDGSINTWTQNIKVKLNNTNNFNEVLNFLNNRYSTDLFKNDVDTKMKSIYLDGCRVLFGNDIINKYAQDFVYIRHMFETLTLDKNNSINDCEFIINVLNHPIYYTKNNKVFNPFTTTIGSDIQVINISSNFLPVLSMNEKLDFLDIAIPSPYQWKLSVNSILPPDCSPHHFISEKNTKLEKIISINFGLNGCHDKSDRTIFINELDNIRKKLNKVLGISIHFGSDNFDSDTFNDSITLDTITFNPSVNYIADKANNNSEFNLYIDGHGSDDYLTRAIFLEGTLIRLKPKNPSSLWYEKFMIPYNFNKSIKENKEADYILIDNFDNDLLNKLKTIIEEPEISKLLRSNLKSKRELIFSSEFINNYLQYILNSINECIGPLDNFVPTDIFKDIIIDPIDRQIIEVRTDNISSLLGRDRKNIKYIQNYTDTTIVVNEEHINKNNIEYQIITVTGPKSGVKKAIEQLNSINNLSNKIIKIKKENMGKIIGISGNNIKKISYDYDVQIFTSIKPSEIIARIAELDIKAPEISEYQFIKIIGNDENVDNAIEYIDSLLTKKQTKFRTKPSISDLSIDKVADVFDENKIIDNTKLPYQLEMDEDDDIVFMDLEGGGSKRKMVKNKSTINKLAIIVPKYNKTNLNYDKFEKKFDEYIRLLVNNIETYINQYNPLTSYEIIIVDGNNLHKIKDNLINKLSIPNELINFSYEDNTSYLRCNKGVMFNYGCLTAKELGCNWGIFQEPFLLPNIQLIDKYFEKPNSSAINLLSTIYEPFINENILGVFSINIDMFIRIGGYPNHIWNYDHINNIFINRLKRNNITIKPLINFNKKYYFEDLYTNYHIMDKETTIMNIELGNMNIISFSKISQLNKLEIIKTNELINEINVQLKPQFIPLASITYILDKYKQLDKKMYNWDEFKKELLLDLDDYYSGIFKQITFKNEEICILSDENIKDILEYQVNLIYEDCYTLPFMQEIEFSILLQSSKIIITKNKNEYIIKIK
jgi:DNA-directed RNA polymerase II subunit RPB2